MTENTKNIDRHINFPKQKVVKAGLNKLLLKK